MTKSSSLFLLTLLFTFLSLFYFEPSRAQSRAAGEAATAAAPPQDGKVKQVALTVKATKAAGASFGRRVVFRSAANVAEAPAQLGAMLGDGAVFDLDKTAAARVLQEKAASMTLPLPDGKGGAIELELVKAEIFAPGFTVRTSGPTNERLEESHGVHYRGIIKGDDRSLAAVSFFKNEVMGFYSTEAGGNSIVGRLNGDNPSDKHVLFAEKDLKSGPDLFCDTADTGDPEMTLPEAAFAETAEQALAKCVRIYVEVGNDLFLNKGTVAATTSYITGMFNQSAALFSNDGIPVSLSEIFVWTTADPYDGTTSLQQLQKFQTTRPAFNGNLAHLVTLESNFGGIAYVPGLCNGNSAYAFSGINSTFSNIPTFSWTVEVFTHETGHNLGSRHTHACAWNGNNTAIDGCAAPEGACAQPPTLPTNGGTIMSYCHLTSAGINFANGFGTQPRDVMLNRINTGTCVTDCGGGGVCTYAVSPASRSFTATGGASTITVTAGGTCPWAATVSAPLPAATFSDVKFPFAGLDSLLAPAALAGGAGDPAAGRDAPVAGLPLVSNSTPITINDAAAANPYPSTINVAGLSGNITKVTATLNGFTHTFPSDVDVLLVGPAGQRAVLMSDAGGSFDVTGVNVTFDQGASAPVPEVGILATGAVRPANYSGAGDNFPAPGPGAAAIGSDLSVFNGTAPNGAWRLYVVDDAGADVGSIASGWSLNITTGAPSWINITAGASGIGNGTVSYTVSPNTGASSRAGSITVNGKTHTITQAGGTAPPPPPPPPVTGRRNVAAATSGATASASSTLNAGLAPSAAINGDRKGLHWGTDPLTGSGWHDAVINSYPDTLQVNFAGSKTINEVVVYSVQDAVRAPSEPTDLMTFTAYGLVNFEVQYWTGAAWARVPNGLVTGNNRVRRTVRFRPLTTSGIRLVVTNGVGGHSRAVEVEAFEVGANVALASAGALATASSTLDAGRGPAGAVNGDWKGLNWGRGGGWHDATANAFPDWLQVDFAGARTIREIDVYTIQDNYAAPVDPSDALVFLRYGITAFEVQYWNGSAWVTVPGGNVTSNNRVWRRFLLSPVTTSRIRVLVHGALAGNSRIVEVEAYQ